MQIEFDRLFQPSSVVIVGASPNKRRISGQPLDILVKGGYRGAIRLVNPNYDAIDGLACHPTVTALPDVPDVALIAVAAPRVAAVLEECGRKGIRFAVVLSSGFAEMGEAGLAQQAELARIADRHGIVLIGPNCQGVMGIADKFRLGFGGPFGIDYRPGGVSLVSQSGAFGNAILMLAEEQGVGFRRYISSGNEVSLTSLDIIEQFIADPLTDVVAAYVEGYRDARRLVEIGRTALAAGKPILAWKVGNSDAGARAAATHTANLAGAPALYRAAFRQAGIIQVNDVDELADCARAFSGRVAAKGHRVGIVTLSGGAGIAMADRCAELGLDVVPFSPSVQDGLRGVLPAFATAQNPLDLTAGIGDDLAAIVHAIGVVASDAQVDMVALALAATSGAMAETLAGEIVRLARQAKKPFFVAWNARAANAARAYTILDDAGVPRLLTPGRCARAMAALADFSRSRRALAAPCPERKSRGIVPALAAELAGADAVLSEHRAKRVLRAFGLAATDERLATSAEEAERFAQAIGYPVAMKVQSGQIAHKSDTGGVRLNLDSGPAARAAFDAIAAAARRHMPDAQIEGILVQEMVVDGCETIVGVLDSAFFGPVVMFGLGGIYAELLNEVTFRIAPVSLAEAHAMVREIRGFGVLDGARGRPRLDVDALAQAIVSVSEMAIELSGVVAELDINPLFVLPAGQGVKVADALIRLHGQQAGPDGKRAAAPAGQRGPAPQAKLEAKAEGRDVCAI